MPDVLKHGSLASEWLRFTFSSSFRVVELQILLQAVDNG